MQRALDCPCRLRRWLGIRRLFHTTLATKLPPLPHELTRLAGNTRHFRLVALAFELLSRQAMKTMRSLFPFVIALAAVSCQSEPDTGKPDQSSLITTEGYALNRSPSVILIVADDANTTDAAQLRGKLTQSLRYALEQEYEARWHGCGNPDPAQWHEGDIRVVLARPSAPDNESLLTSVEIPNLAWTTKTSKMEEIDAVVAAATEGLEKRLATAGDVYRPLHATARAVDLITGARKAENDAENGFVTSLPRDFLLQVFTASTRSDDDPTLISQLLPTPVMNENLLDIRYSVITPSTMGDALCQVNGPGASRIEYWANQVQANVYAWPCNDDKALDSIMIAGFADCGPMCYSRPLLIAADGTVQCKAYIEQPDLERCDAERGWRDPDGKATLVERNGETRRKCEIVQHSGAALEACRKTVECTNCGGGFCATEVTEIQQWKDSPCNGSDVQWPLRFTGGSVTGANSWVTISCLTSN